MKTDPKTIRDRGLSKDEAEVLAATLIENEDEIRHCSGDCSDCHRVNSCFN